VAPSSSADQSTDGGRGLLSRRISGWFFASRVVEVSLLLLVLLISGLTFGGIALPFKVVYSPPPAHSISGTGPQHLPSGGTVLRAEQHGSTTRLLMRSSLDRNSTLALTPASALIARDGHRLSVTSILPGDDLNIQKNNVITDLSQQLASLTGTVTPISGNPTTVLILKLNPSRSIVVDVGPGTKITGPSGSIGSGLVILDADRVRVEGMLDAKRAEVTQAETIVQLTDWAQQHGKAA
jgi:hypothetical protein